MNDAGLLIIRGADDLRNLLDRPLTCPRSLRLTQGQIDTYADIVEDHQWIHVDRERCRTESPFGSTIAHGFLTLSLLPWMAANVPDGPRLAGARMGVNYGADRLRFLSPVPSGARVRGRFKLLGFEEKRPGQFQQVSAVTVEIEGQDKPALIADWIGQTLV